jgi:hypothetical protein
MSCKITNGVKSVFITDEFFTKWVERRYSYNISYSIQNGSMSLEIKNGDDVIFYGAYPIAKELNDFI